MNMELFLKIAFAVVIVLAAIRFFYRQFRYNQTLKLGQRRRALRDSQTFNFDQVSNEKVKKILDADVETLRMLQIKGEVSSMEIVTVFSQRCYTIGRRLNLVTEEYYTEAFEMAKKKDIEREQAVKKNEAHKLGPLHGIPVSIKDHICERGRISTVGCTHYANYIAKEDADIVTQIKAHGGIPFVKSNVPQLVFALQSDNQIYGLSKNPYDPLRGCGGSSGGEGGLISAKCSPLGFGTDIGGSVRSPASFCGVYGYRPTPQRCSYKGVVVPVEDGICPQSAITPAIGPLANSVNDLKIAMQTILTVNETQSDNSCPPLGFNDQQYQNVLQKKLKIGYIDEFPLFAPSNAVRRAMKIAREKLQAQGHELVAFPFSREDHLEMKTIYMQSCGIAFMSQFKKALDDNYEAPIGIYKDFFFYYGLHPVFKFLLRSVISTFMSKRLASDLKNFKKFSSEEIDSILRKQFRFEKMMKNRWESYNLDAMICPSFYHCAFKHTEQNELSFKADYFMLWNVMHFPAGVVPITLVQEGEDKDYNDGINDLITTKCRESMQGSVGMPISIQVAAPKWRDEQCLAVMKILEDSVKFKYSPPNI